MATRLAEKGEEIALLHIQDACVAAVSNKYCDRLLEASISIYALKADVEARGLAEKLHTNVETIDYKQWVSLLMRGHGKIVSWTS